jgi:hypothetical protein
MAIVTQDCPARSIFLELEHDALLAIKRAEKVTDFPLIELGAFLGHQAARWRHEEMCPTCAQHGDAA